MEIILTNIKMEYFVKIVIKRPDKMQIIFLLFYDSIISTKLKEA